MREPISSAFCHCKIKCIPIGSWSSAILRGIPCILWCRIRRFSASHRPYSGEDSIKQGRGLCKMVLLLCSSLHCGPNSFHDSRQLGSRQRAMMRPAHLPIRLMNPNCAIDPQPSRAPDGGERSRQGQPQRSQGGRTCSRGMGHHRGGRAPLLPPVSRHVAHGGGRSGRISDGWGRNRSRRASTEAERCSEGGTGGSAAGGGLAWLEADRNGTHTGPQPRPDPFPLG